MFPERCVFLVFFGLLSRGRIVLNEPSEVFCVVDLFAEHLFAAGGVTYQLVSFFCATQAVFIKKIQARGGLCGEKDGVKKNKKGIRRYGYK